MYYAKIHIRLSEYMPAWSLLFLWWVLSAYHSCQWVESKFRSQRTYVVCQNQLESIGRSSVVDWVKCFLLSATHLPLSAQPLWWSVPLCPCLSTSLVVCSTLSLSVRLSGGLFHSVPVCQPLWWSVPLCPCLSASLVVWSTVPICQPLWLSVPVYPYLSLSQKCSLHNKHSQRLEHCFWWTRKTSAEYPHILKGLSFLRQKRREWTFLMISSVF